MEIENLFKTAVLHHGKKNFSKAKEIYEVLLQKNPDNLAILQNYAALLAQIKNYKEADNIFKKCLKIKPKDPLLLYNYGKLFHDQKVFDKAAEFYKESFAADPKNDIVLYNLGNIYSALKKFKKSIECFKKAIEINPSNFLAYNNMGFSYKYTGNFEEAEKFYKKAIEKKSDYIEAHLNYSTMLLSLKKFENGFKEYEWRKKSKIFSDYLNYANLEIKTPTWNGEDLKNKTILIFAEQGIGDLFQFSRYLYLLRKQFQCNVILRLKHNLSHLFDSQIIKTISEKDDIPAHDFHNHLMSLPGIFYKENKSFPSNKNFIQFDENKSKEWKKFFNSFTGLKVGINADSTTRSGATGQLQRMIPIEQFKILTDLKNINFFIIQKDFDKKNLNLINKNSNVNYFEKLDKNVKPFEDTIGVIKNLDLIITADTSLAHLAGTLEKNTWIALPFVSDWRWFQDEKKSQWYKNVSLYRQGQTSSWEEVFKIIKRDLEKKLKN